MRIIMGFVDLMEINGTQAQMRLVMDEASTDANSGVSDSIECILNSAAWLRKGIPCLTLARALFFCQPRRSGRKLRPCLLQLGSPLFQLLLQAKRAVRRPRTRLGARAFNPATTPC